MLATWLDVGILGFAVAAVVGNILATINNLIINGRLVDIRWRPFLVNLLPPALIAVASTGVWWLLSPYFSGFAVWPGLLLVCLIWCSAYGVLTLAFNRQALDLIFGAVRGWRQRRTPQ